MSYSSCCFLSYNRPSFLARALQTAQLHACSPHELLVHDDGSSRDGTPEGEPHMPEYLLDYLSRNMVSSLILNPGGHNQGQGVALNRMFGMATGDPILKLDQDLIFAPEWLKRVKDLLDANDAAADRGEEPRIGLLGLLHYHLEPVDSAKTRIEQFDGWSSRTHILGSGFALTRRCWEALGPFDEHSEAFAEDWSMQQAVTAHPEYVCALPDDDLCVNQGMGIGPSTVVVGPGKVAEIHRGPYLIGTRDSNLKANYG